MEAQIEAEETNYLAKVPQVTLVFWIIKILATTLGETGGDAVTMSWLGEASPDADPSTVAYGYLIGTLIFGVIFAVAVAIQIRASKFHPFLYWFTIIATTTVGTTLADFATRSIGVGYPGGSIILFVCVIATLAFWRWSMGTVSVESVSTPKAEIFYWLTIMFSQTLGTALGDWVADSDLGYLGAAAIFGGLLIITAGLYFWTSISHVLLFWAAFILTRPLGAVVGDFLDKPTENGGLELSRTAATAVLLALIVAMILIFRQRPAERAH